MKTSTTPKLLIHSTRLLVFIFLLAVFSCKKVNNDLQADMPTKTNQKLVADLLFATAPGSDLKITQLSPDKKMQRILVPVEGNENLKLFKYVLIEQGTESNAFKIGKLLSKTKIDGDNNLFNLPLANDGRLNYFDENQPENTGSKVLMKTKGTKVTSESVAEDLQDETSSNYAPVCTGGYCIDHWWVIYNTETGQIYSITYLGSDCYEAQCSEGGGGGGGGGGNNGCNLTEAEAQVLLDLTTSQSDNGEIWSYTGTVTGPDAEGIIRAAKTVRGGGFSLHIAGNWWVRWATNFAGIVYKRSIPHNDPWKWETVNYTGFTQYEGSLPPCTSAEPSANCIPLISADKRNFQQTGNFQVRLNWTCGIYTEFRVFTGSLGGSYSADVSIPYE